MFPFIKNKNKMTGIDVGLYTIKVVTLEKHTNQLKLIGFGTIAHDNSQKVKAFLSKLNCNGGIIGVNAPFLKVKTKVIELPKMPDEELGEAIAWQIKDIIDSPPEEYITRYLKFPTASPDNKKMSLMVFTQKKKD